MKNATHAGEQIITDWSLAPLGVRSRATQLLAKCSKGCTVLIMKLKPSGLLTEGAWAVAVAAANGGRRVLTYAEDHEGQMLAEWLDGEDRF